MAYTPLSARQRRSERGHSPRGLPSMSPRQLDAYLLAREAVRRVRAVAALTAPVRPERAPSAAPR